MMPFARIEAASSSRRSGRKMVRGWTGFGEIASSGSDNPVGDLSLVNDFGGTLAGATGAAVLGGRRAARPLPSGLCVLSLPVLILKYLSCQFKVTLCAPGAGVVHQNWLSVTRSLRQTDTPRDDRGQNVVLKEVPQIVGHCA